jgi:uncharacterized protein YndB with AHSA1/START domain
VTGRVDTASRLVRASPTAVYRAFVDPGALMTWLPPEGMSGRVLLFEPWEGGRYRIELTLLGEGHGLSGKTTERTDVTGGRFLELVPDRRIVQSVEFESADPAFAGTMLMSWTLEPAPGGTGVTVTARDVPPGIPAEDHAAGLASSLDNLAAALRADEPRPRGPPRADQREA